MKKNTIVRHCFSRKYISLCIFLLLGIIGEKAFAYSVWETYANETEGIYFSLQESIKITGVVKDNKGEPIIGANIVELNKKGNGTITDIDGKFTLSVSKNAEISISFIGFDEKKIKIGQQTSFDIILEESSQFLDEVVVVGMNNRQTRRSVTGAISTIQTKELKQSPVANLSNALAGKLPGLITVQTSGQPGEDASSLFIRGVGTYGTSNPLVVIDGLPRSQTDFNQLDANEIESVTILKDASSSSLYGIQGANGVIVVTTKRGVDREKPLISFTVQQAVQQPIRLPETMSSYEQALYYRDMDMNDGQTERYTPEVLDIIKNGSDPYLYPNVNWFDEILKKNSMQSQYNINISGSALGKLRYFISGSYVNQGTLLKHQDIFEKNYGVKSKFDRYNFRSNVDLDATSMLNIRIDLAGRLETRVGPGSDFSNVFSVITTRSPSSQPVFNPDGTLGAGSALEIPFQQNPYGIVTQSGYYTRHTNVMSGTLSAKHKLDFITKGLSAQVYFSFESNNYQHTTRLQSFDSFWYKGKDATGEAIYQPHSVKSRLSTTDSRWVERYTYLDVRLNYDRTFAEKHQISAQLLGNRTLRSQNAELPYAYQGISSRIAYNFDTRYYLEANIGYNGSENFPPKKRYGFFPSFSAGWVLSDEKFISLPSWIQLIKLRGSYGTVGNDKIGGQRWLYITEFTPGGTAMGTYQFGVSPQSVAGYNESRVGNKFVTWEKSAKGNVGFDLSLFKDNAVQFTFDYFWEKRNNILTTPGDVPDYVGITNVAPRNSGKVENKGIEAELRFNKRINKDLSIFANLQMTYARNKVLENDEPIPAFDYQDLRGYEIGYVLGYKSAGLFQDEEDIRNSPTQSFGTVVPGDIKYVDTNKDGVIDAFDRVPIKVNNVPRSMSGLSLGVTYKNFDFSMLMNASTGGTAYLYTYPSSKINLERWTAENKNARIPAAHSTTNNTVVTDHFVQNTDYIKLRNVEIGYTLPKKFLSSLRISTARIYLNGQNLAVWDKMWLKDCDPESAGGAALAYPLQRVFNIGIHVEL